MSVAKTRAAPARSAIATAMSPIGPQPSTTTVWPAISSTNAAWTALPIGSWIAAISGARPVRSARRCGRAARRTRRTPRRCRRRGSAGWRRRARGRSGTGSRCRRRGGSRPPRACPAGSPAGRAGPGRGPRRGRPSRGRRSGAGRSPSRPCGPVVPAVDVQVRAAEAGRLDADQQLARAGDRHRDLEELRARARRRLDEGVHRRRHRAARACRVGGRDGAVSSRGRDLLGDDRVVDAADTADLDPDPVAGLEEGRRVAEDAHARTACRSR